MIPELPRFSVTEINVLTPIGQHLPGKTQVEIMVNRYASEAVMFQQEGPLAGMHVHAVEVMPLGLAVVQPDDHFIRIGMAQAGEVRRHAGKRGEISHRLRVDVDGIQMPVFVAIFILGAVPLSRETDSSPWEEGRDTKGVLRDSRYGL